MGQVQQLKVKQGMKLARLGIRQTDLVTHSSNTISDRPVGDINVDPKLNSCRSKVVITKISNTKH